MNQTVATQTEPNLSNAIAAAFAIIDRSFNDASSDELIKILVHQLKRLDDPRMLLEALLLEARQDLGMPLVQPGSLTDFAEPTRSLYEERYVEAIRSVGQRLLDQGKIPAAWAYFRALGEKEPIVDAIEAFKHNPEEPADDLLGQVIDIAFNQGVLPSKGFELILEHYGTCSAITAFEQLQAEEELRVACASKLVRRLHADLAANLRADIERAGQTKPSDASAAIGALIDGRDWMFADDAYHIDVSHLAAIVRASLLIRDPETLELALELCDYGDKLSSRHKYEGLSPFDNVFRDHAIYLRALLGKEVENAIEHFQGKVTSAAAEAAERGYASQTDSLPAQVLILLLNRLQRNEQAIEVAALHLAEVPDASLICPSLPKLCAAANRLDRLAEISRNRGDLVHYLAARLATRERSTVKK